MEISHLAQFAFGLMDVLVFIRLEGVGTPQASSHSWVNNQRGVPWRSKDVRSATRAFCDGGTSS